jgi:hypothetical protein
MDSMAKKQNVDNGGRLELKIMQKCADFFVNFPVPEPAF